MAIVHKQPPDLLKGTGYPSHRVFNTFTDILMARGWVSNPTSWA